MMCDSDSSSDLSDPAPSASCSNQFEDLDPDVRDKFGRLASVLKETNQNLVTFEFLLSHYRSLARVAPLPASPGIASPLAAVTPLQSLTVRAPGIENRVDSEEILDLLRNISQSVDGFRDQLHVAAEDIGDAVEHIEVDGVGESKPSKDVDLLEQDRKLVEKDKEIIELKNALIKLEKELLEERQVAEVRADLTKQMEKKLDSERLAAKEMAKEIKYYVEKLSKLEARKSVEMVKVDKCFGTISVETVDRYVSTENNFSVRPLKTMEQMDQCVGTDANSSFCDKTERLELQLDQEKGANQQLIVKNEQLGDKLWEVEKNNQQLIVKNEQLGDKLWEVEKNNQQLVMKNEHLGDKLWEAEKNNQQLVMKNEHLGDRLREAEKNNHQLVLKNEQLGDRLREAEKNVAIKEESRVRLKSKTRTLLKQYRVKRTSVEKKDLQLSKLRQGLLHLRSLCENIECNYQVILHHLGAQIHVAARLMSLHHPNHTIPGELPGKLAGLGAWFQEIQGMASWLQKSVAVLGVGGGGNMLEMDMSRSTVYRRVRGEQDTQSDMTMLDEEAALEAVRVCEAGLNEQNTTVNSLIGCIDIS